MLGVGHERVDPLESPVIACLAPQLVRVRRWDPGWKTKPRLVISGTAAAPTPRCDAVGKSLPTTFQDWANTKAAHRFFSNENVSEDRILAGHFAASALRVEAVDGAILMLQDTTEFSFQRATLEKIGFTKTSTGHKTKEGRHHQHTICGLLMPASLAVTPDGPPLDLTAVKVGSRDKFKGTGQH